MRRFFAWSRWPGFGGATLAKENEAESPRCERCGSPDALEVGGRSICEECYSQSESCCLEFGADDLWEDREAEAEKDRPGATPA